MHLAVFSEVSFGEVFVEGRGGGVLISCMAVVVWP